jgi:hypothetical protein
MEKHQIINALHSSAQEIRRLRRQIIEVKAEAWDVHSEVIKRIFSGNAIFGECPASMAEMAAEALQIEQAAQETSKSA